MIKMPRVVIVGRTNVGKSSLFNRLIKKRLAIVSDTAQTTRDRLYGLCQWLTKKFILVDTGGISNDSIDFQTEINEQAQIAINEADIILFVCSYQEGLTPGDEIIARLLYKINKPVILVANKYDQIDNSDLIYDFLSLGFDLPLLISSAHGINTGEVLDKIVSLIASARHEEVETVTRLGIIGRPNVGKSSLVNAILQEKRAIVSPIKGTTTDATDTYFKYQKQQFCLIDTAGIRQKGRVTTDLEKYSIVRTISAIKRSDIILFLLDASEGIIEQDLTVAGNAKNLDKPVIIVVNKWDLVAKDEHTMTKFNKEIKNKFKYLGYALVTFLSAETGMRINILFEKINLLLSNMTTRVKTSVLNEILTKAQIINQTPNFNGGRLKIYFGSQVGCNPPTFVLMVNNKKYCHFSYQRFLVNQIEEHFNFDGLPIKIILRNRKSLYKDEHD